MNKNLKYKSIPLIQITRSPQHWNRAVTKDDIEDLATSVDSVGLLHPIIVRKTKKGYEYLAGERRYLASKSRGAREIRCTVVECSDKEAREISLVENIKAKKPTPSELREGIKELVGLEKSRITKPSEVPKHTPRGGRPMKEDFIVVSRVAKKVGTDVQTVREIIDLEKLVPPAKYQLDRGGINQAQAKLLTTMSKDDQRVQLAHMLRETRKQTEGRISTEVMKDADPNKAEREAVRAFGRLLSGSKELLGECDRFRNSLNDHTTEVIYKENRDDLVDLHRSLSQLIRDIELAENGI
jgi:ParB-like chromosome segregation protein Spo0J